MRVPPFTQLRILLESNPIKSRILVRRWAADAAARVGWRSPPRAPEVGVLCRGGTGSCLRAAGFVHVGSGSVCSVRACFPMGCLLHAPSGCVPVRARPSLGISAAVREPGSQSTSPPSCRNLPTNMLGSGLPSSWGLDFQAVGFHPPRFQDAGLADFGRGFRLCAPSRARIRRAAEPGALIGFQTGSGQTGFSQKGHISLHFVIFVSSPHVSPHFATFCYILLYLLHFVTFCCIWLHLVTFGYIFP